MFDITYNPVRKIWCVWRTIGNTSEIVKTFKSESAARRWIERQ